MHFALLILSLIFYVDSFPSKKVLNLFEEDKLEFSENLNKFPKVILKEMETILDEEILLAGPNENFNKSDAIEDETWPFRRMIFLAWTKTKKEWLLYYEIGGRAHNTRLVYSQFDKNNKIKKLYCLAPDFYGNFTTSKDFLIEQMKSGNYATMYNNGKPRKIPYVPF